MSSWNLTDLLEDVRLYFVSFWPDFYVVKSEWLDPVKYPTRIHSVWQRILTVLYRQPLSVQISVSVLCFLVLLISVFKIYSKLTCGWCKSKVRMEGKVVLITGANIGNIETPISTVYS